MIKERDIEISDIALNKVESQMFIGFYSGFIESEGYGGQNYFQNHPQLSKDLIEALVDKKVSIIGVDFSGVRRGKEHTPIDQYCADRGVFIVENLCNLKSVLKHNCEFIACTYPMNFSNMSGLPCRVIAKV